MGVMNFVFPITALYFGRAALALYWRWGRVGAPPARAPSPKTGAKMPAMAMAAAGQGMREGPDHSVGPKGHDGSADRVMPARPRWATMAIEVSHCGSGCTLGDLISEWVIFAFALTVAGRVLERRRGFCSSPPASSSSSPGGAAGAATKRKALTDCSPERALARRRLAPRRRGVALGRLCTRPGRSAAGDCLRGGAIARDRWRVWSPGRQLDRELSDFGTRKAVVSGSPPGCLLHA
jgi:hypothetical protein